MVTLDYSEDSGMQTHPLSTVSQWQFPYPSASRYSVFSHHGSVASCVHDYCNCLQGSGGVGGWGWRLSAGCMRESRTTAHYTCTVNRRQFYDDSPPLNLDNAPSPTSAGQVVIDTRHWPSTGSRCVVKSFQEMSNLWNSVQQEKVLCWEN